MKKYAEGSTVLIVVFVMSALIICYATVWHSISFFSDMAIKKQEYEQRYRIADGILKSGIVFCKKRYDYLKKLLTPQNPVLSMDMGFWKIDDMVGYDGKVIISFKKDLHIQAVVSDKKREMFKISCRMSKSNQKDAQKKDNDLFIVRHWKIDSESAK